MLIPILRALLRSEARQEVILERLGKMNRQLERLERVSKGVIRGMTDLRKDFDEALTNLGNEITALTDRIASLPDAEDVTQADVDAIRGQASRLRSLAASDDVPVPVEPAPEPAGTTTGTETGPPEGQAANPES